MFKERIKSALIVALIANALFLVSQLWLGNMVWQDAESVFSSWTNNPVFRFFAPRQATLSVPRENLSRPRRLVINDGSLWVAYYNTDSSFDALAARARFFVSAFLRGSAKREGSLTYAQWLDYMSERSLYAEYPIAMAPTLLARTMGITATDIDDDLSAIKEMLILPSDASNGVRLLARNEDRIIMYSFDRTLYSFPESYLVEYSRTNPSDGYYEFAFSTLLGLSEERQVQLDDMVLFSDTEQTASAIYPMSVISDGDYSSILNAFYFNAQPLRHYTDSDMSVNFVENYATIKIYPDELLEYSAISPQRGIRLCDADAPLYETVNAAIDFAERVWAACNTQTALNVLVSGDLLDEENDGRRTITFDYYFDGRPIVVNIEGADREAMKSGIELEILDGRLVSYRQLLRNYTKTQYSERSVNFVTALDYFVSEFSQREESVVIEDLFLGYMDSGTQEQLTASWVARLRGGEIYERRIEQ
ncbi:MAG: hypothetical protein Q4C12_02510 [Clostridia bacterium]|nr:hypothetical protein [Clostridia bacterium]